jgi:hypothetical protein
VHSLKYIMSLEHPMAYENTMWRATCPIIAQSSGRPEKAGIEPERANLRFQGPAAFPARAGLSPS